MSIFTHLTMNWLHLILAHNKVIYLYNIEVGMIHTNLRKVGGSVMLAVPPTLLKSLGLDAGKEVSLSIVNGKLVVEPKAKPSYKLADLLQEHQALALEQDAWHDVKAVGREEI